jgi:dTMP kinase
VGLKRALERSRTSKGDRFEREKAQFHQRVRKGYLTIARNEPQRVKVIDTRKGPDKVFEKIRDIVDNLIGLKESRGQGVKRK